MEARNIEVEWEVKSENRVFDVVVLDETNLPKWMSNETYNALYKADYVENTRLTLTPTQTEVEGNLYFVVKNHYDQEETASTIGLVTPKIITLDNYEYTDYDFLTGAGTLFVGTTTFRVTVAELDNLPFRFTVIKSTYYSDWLLGMNGNIWTYWDENGQSAYDFTFEWEPESWQEALYFVVSKEDQTRRSVYVSIEELENVQVAISLEHSTAASWEEMISPARWPWWLLLYFSTSAVLAAWVYRDSKDRRMNRGGWAGLTFLTSVVGLAAYLRRRRPMRRG